MKLTFNRKNLIVFVVLFSMILPFINFFNFGIPVVYFFTPIGMVIVMCALFGGIKVPSLTKLIIFLSLMVLLQILVATLYSTVNKLGYFVFPTDIVQYIVRFIFLISFIILAYKGRIDKDKFIKYFLIVLNIGMAIGILQWIPWPGRELLISLYPFRDGTEQLSHLSRSLNTIRLHGFAQHATANGGIASFAIAYAYSVKRYYGRYKKMSLILLMLSIINLLASQARAGMLAAAFSIVLFYFVNLKYEKKTLKPTAYFISVLTGIVLIITYLYNKGNAFIVRIVYRWGVLFETGGGTRATTQPQYFFSLMEGADYIFGLSKPYINRSAISYGIEVEPVNIFVTYGASGFLLQYSFIAILLVYFFKKVSKRTRDKAALTLCIASFVGVFGYQIFSLAYFFFREIRIGLFPWVLMGVTIGVYERYKLANRQLKGYQEAICEGLKYEDNAYL